MLYTSKEKQIEHNAKLDESNASLNADLDSVWRVARLLPLSRFGGGWAERVAEITNYPSDDFTCCYPFR